MCIPKQIDHRCAEQTDAHTQHAVKEGVMYPEGYGQRVLVVDDDANVRSLLSVLLTYEGYNVFEAGDGLDAFQELKKRHFDVVISDYHMPRFDGMQLLAVCRIAWPETAVVIVSGEDSDWTDRAIRGGAHACVKKPWERTHLIGELRQAIGKVSARTAPQQVRA
jgi:CheY-like chemotaxis protein